MARLSEAIGRAFRERPIGTSLGIGALGGAGALSANQILNMADPSRREQIASIRSGMYADMLKDMYGQAGDVAAQEVKQQLGPLLSSYGEGIASGAKESVMDAYKRLLQRPGPALTAAGLAVGVPSAVGGGLYLYNLLQKKRQTARRNEEARKRKRLRRARAGRKRRREEKTLLERIRAATPSINFKLASRVSRVADDLPLARHIGRTSLGLGLLGTGAGAAAIGVPIWRMNKNLSGINEALASPEGADKVREYAERTAGLLSENIDAGALGRAGGEAALEYLKHPLPWLGIGAFVGAPYLLAHILKKREQEGGRGRRRVKKAQAQDDYGQTPINWPGVGLTAGGALSAGGLLIPRRTRRAAGLAAAATIPAFGYASLADPYIVDKTIAKVAPPFTRAINKGLELAVGDEAYTSPEEFASQLNKDYIREIARGAPNKEDVAAAAKAPVQTISDYVQDKPWRAGLTAGAGLTAAGLLGYLAWKRWKKYTEDAAETMGYTL